jgi:hypothetical protein
MSTTIPPPSLEHPVAELTPQREDPSEEALVDESAELDQTRQVQLVVHHADRQVARCTHPCEVDGLGKCLGGGLLGVDVLARGDRRAQRGRPRRCRLGVEVDVDGRVAEHGVEVGRPFGHAVAVGQLLDPLRTAADEDRLDANALTAVQEDAPGVSDGQDRADQVLAVTHPPRDPVHGDAQCAGRHRCLSSARVRRQVARRVRNALSSVARRSGRVNRFVDRASRQRSGVHWADQAQLEVGSDVRIVTSGMVEVRRAFEVGGEVVLVLPMEPRWRSGAGSRSTSPTAERSTSSSLTRPRHSVSAADV